MIFLPTGKHRTPEDEDQHRQRQSRGLGHMLGICGLIFLVLEAFLGTMLVLPAWLELQSLQQKRDLAVYKLERERDEEEEAHDRFVWMMDPEYFEQVARDRANQAKDGEIVIRRPSASSRRMLPATPENDRPNAH